MTAPFLCSASGYVLDVPDVPDVPELLELPELLEYLESPEHPESPRPDFFSSGINNKKQETLAYTSWRRYG